MFWIRVLTICAFILGVGIAAGPVAAQNDNVVGEIVVQGTHRIEQNTVKSYLLLQEGDRFDRRRMDQSVKSLFATGLFADVFISRQAGTLIVKVVENPVINRIAFEGNRRVEDKELRTEITLRPRVVFTRAKVQNDVKRILDVYRVSGRFATVVEPKVIQLPQNRADLVFEIDEGPLTSVERIRFIGNNAESDSDLRSIIRTKESVWYRFLSSDDTYDPDRLTFDRELLRRHYLSEGYADFRVDSAVAELTPRKNAFFITFTVNEGPRYKFGSVDVAAGLRGLDAKDLQSLIKFKKGDWYDNSVVDEAIDKIVDKVGTKGYAFVEVRPRIDRNRKARQINLTFDIREGPRVFVERIDISGNVRTVDKVVRREFRLIEGDAFNAAKLRRSRKRVHDLNYFEKVTIERQQGSAPDKAVVKVNVEEKSTGSLSVGVGYSTDNGPLVDFGVSERNLLGRGQRMSLKVSLAAEKSTFNIGFTEPYFLDREIIAGLDAFHKQSNLQDSSSYNWRQTGFGLRAGFPLSPDLFQNWRYRFELSEIADVASNASNLIKIQEGTRYVSLVGHALSYDLRDSAVNPTEGFILRLSNDVAGLGGTVRNFRNQLKAAQYYSPFKDMILSLEGRAGHILGMGQDVEVPDRYFLGGDSLRGFATSGAGPRDKVTKDSLGGEWVYNGSIQASFPLGFPEELAVSGKLFTDFGSLGSVNPSDSNVFDSASLRLSAGAGIGWVSPFGPINIDFGFPLLKESLDETELMRLNFGTRF